MPYNHLNYNSINAATSQKKDLLKIIIISFSIHISIFLIIFLSINIEKKKKFVKKQYLFDMVDVKTSFKRPTQKKPVIKKTQIKKTKPVTKKKEVTKKNIIKKQKIKNETTNDDQKKQEQIKDKREKIQENKEVNSKNELNIQKKNFPFRFYEQQIINAVESNWNPPQELLGNELSLHVIVKFTILKNGQVTNLKIKESSWNSILDKLALRAIEKANIPPIPGPDKKLPITYKLVLKR